MVEEGLVRIDISDPDLFTPYVPKVVPPGEHLFAIANELKPAPAKKGTGNTVISVELRCQDEGEFRGSVVFDNIVIMNNPQTPGQLKATKINQARLAQLAISSGTHTQDEIRAGGNIYLSRLKDTYVKAVTFVESSKNSDTGEVIPRARVARYLFEPLK